jgi:hypothetical protein
MSLIRGGTKFSHQQQQDPFGSVFTQVASKLHGDGDFRKALDYIGSRIDRSRYKTATDFLFCELFRSPWPERCRKYYAGEGPSLDECVATEDIEDFQRILLHALNLAFINACHHRHIAWSRFRSEVLSGAVKSGIRRPRPRWPKAHRSSAAQ